MIKYLLSAILATFLVSMTAFSQKADWQKITVSYKQLPLKPAAPMAKTYMMEIIMDSEGILKQMMADRDELVSSITKTNTLLAKQGKAQQMIPQDDNYYPVSRDAMTVKNALRLEGCTEVQNAPEFSVKVQVAGFNWISTKMNTKTTTTNNVQTTTYTQEVSCTYKISYQVYGSSGNLIRQEIAGGSDQVSRKETKTFTSQAELDAWWAVLYNRNTFLTQFDNELYQRAIENARQQVNNEMGYPVKAVRIDVATAQNSKGFDYTDMQKAYQDAAVAYNYLPTDLSKAKDFLLKAVTAWEATLSQSNLSSKKARINENITGALFVNLAVAYCYLEDWEKSELYLIKLKAMDKGGVLKNKLEYAQYIKNDYEARIKANKP